MKLAFLNVTEVVENPKLTIELHRLNTICRPIKIQDDGT